MPEQSVGTTCLPCASNLKFGALARTYQITMIADISTAGQTRVDLSRLP